MKIAERKQRAIALLESAVQGIEEELEPELRPLESGGPEFSGRNITDAELRGTLLTHFYGLRHSNGGFVPVDDMIISGTEPVTLEAIGGVCRQMADAGLIEWTGYLGRGPTIGSARITSQGINAVERGEAASINIQFPSKNPRAPSSPMTNDAPLPDAALTEIRQVVRTIKSELPRSCCQTVRKPR
jgi:hypothetical protein